MVNDNVQEFYGVGANHHVEVHDATANITLRGTVTEMTLGSDSHISTTCRASEAKPGESMKL
jgi:hypothetical protein